MSNASHAARIEGPAYVKKYLSLGFAHYSCLVGRHGRVERFYLLRDSDDLVGIQVCSAMVDVAERLEIGIIGIAPVRLDRDRIRIIPLPGHWNGKVTAKRLVLRNDFGTFDSGVVFSRAGKDIVVVAGDYPYTLSVQSEFLASSARPEYPLNNYATLPFDASIQDSAEGDRLP